MQVRRLRKAEHFTVKNATKRFASTKGQRFRDARTVVALPMMSVLKKQAAAKELYVEIAGDGLITPKEA
jgi:hypothetical protein